MRVSIGFRRSPILDRAELATCAREAERTGVFAEWPAEARAHDFAAPLAAALGRSVPSG